MVGEGNIFKKSHGTAYFGGCFLLLEAVTLQLKPVCPLEILVGSNYTVRRVLLLIAGHDMDDSPPALLPGVHVCTSMFHTAAFHPRVDDAREGVILTSIKQVETWSVSLRTAFVDAVGCETRSQLHYYFPRRLGIVHLISFLSKGLFVSSSRLGVRKEGWAGSEEQVQGHIGAGARARAVRFSLGRACGFFSPCLFWGGGARGLCVVLTVW